MVLVNYSCWTLTPFGGRERHVIKARKAATDDGVVPTPYILPVPLDQRSPAVNEPLSILVGGETLYANCDVNAARKVAEHVMGAEWEKASHVAKAELIGAVLHAIRRYVHATGTTAGLRYQATEDGTATVPIPAAVPTIAAHGTQAGYAADCRCRDCTATMREIARTRRLSDADPLDWSFPGGEAL